MVSLIGLTHDQQCLKSLKRFTSSGNHLICKAYNECQPGIHSHSNSRSLSSDEFKLLRTLSVVVELPTACLRTNIMPYCLAQIFIIWSFVLAFCASTIGI